MDTKKGEYGGNVFYRMQILHETNRDVYLVFTRYGRIGDSGQHQMTAFGKKEEAIEDFRKVFHSKSGNQWNPSGTFEKVKNKYKLVKFNSVEAKEILVDFYESRLEADLPPCDLQPKVKDLFKEVASSKVLYSRVTNELKIDISQLPLSKLNKPDLMQAMTILQELQKAAREHTKESSVDITDLDSKKIAELLDDIADMTSQYYELVPTT